MPFNLERLRQRRDAFDDLVHQFEQRMEQLRLIGDDDAYTELVDRGRRYAWANISEAAGEFRSCSRSNVDTQQHGNDMARIRRFMRIAQPAITLRQLLEMGNWLCIRFAFVDLVATMVDGQGLEIPGIRDANGRLPQLNLEDIPDHIRH